MREFVNQLLDQQFLFSDYINIGGKLLFFTLLAGAFVLVVTFLHYAVEDSPTLKYLSELVLIALLIAVLISFVVAGFIVVMYPFLVIGSVLKSYLVVYITNEPVLNFVSLFLSAFMIIYVVSYIFNKGSDHLQIIENEDIKEW